jgi:molybdopterin-containing oxidoreductase family iron-sulfur binding subunit
MKRRDFLKIACFSVAGLPARSAFDQLIGKALAKQPGVGKPKWAMVIDIKACTAKPGCQRCIDACHNIHNVPTFNNPKDEIKWIWTNPYKEVFPEQTYQFSSVEVQKQPILVLCNHCENPPCVKVCPTKATFKRDDGLVMMDYHRCIGCRYCMAACPYGARSFNWKDPRPFIKGFRQDFPTRTKGVVEKCSFCEERLAKGLKPACVEACTAGALTFGDLNEPDSQVRNLLALRPSVRRKAHLGTEPKVFYIL